MTEQGTTLEAPISRPMKAAPARPRLAAILSLVCGLLVLLTLATGVISYLDSLRFRDGLVAIGDHDVELLRRATHLMQHGEALSAMAPRIVTAADKQDLRRRQELTADQMSIMKMDVDRLRAIGVPADSMDTLAERRIEFMENMERLVDLLARRFDARTDLTQAVRKREDDLLAARSQVFDQLKSRASQLDPNTTNALLSVDRAWTQIMQALDLNTEQQLETARAEIEETLELAGLLTVSLPESPVNDGIKGALRNLGDDISQDRALLAMKLRLIQLDGQIAGLILHNDNLVNRLTAALSDFYRRLENDVAQRKDRIIEDNRRDRFILMVIVGFAGVAGLLLLAYITRIIGRLARLRHAMSSHARGEAADIPLDGDDELTEMGRNLDHFVNEISRLALTDPLTGLDNRASFTRRFEESMQMARRRHHPVALLLLDLDAFKPVNDTFGHPVGDAVLQHVARTMREAFRETDVIARLGGDEFGVILTSLEEGRTANIPARRVVDAIAEPIQVGEDVIHIGASIGIVYFPSQGEEMDDLIRKAGLALRAAKSFGRNNFQVFDPSMLTQ